MKISIIKIGNSKGIRIPKPLLEESGLDETVEIRAKKGEIRLTPAKTKYNYTYLMSREALAKEWDTPEEDAAWSVYNQER